MNNSQSPEINEKKPDQLIKIVTEGGHAVVINDAEGRIRIESAKGNVFELDERNHAMLMRDESNHNEIRMDRKGLTISSAGEIKFESTRKVSVQTESFDVSSNGSIRMKATADVDISGMNISNKALMNHRVQAMDVRSKADVCHRTEGVQIDSNASMMIKSNSPVMLLNGNGLFAMAEASGIELVPPTENEAIGEK